VPLGYDAGEKRERLFCPEYVGSPI